MHCNAEFYYVGKIPRTGIGHGYSPPVQERRVVLRRRNTVVGGKCALTSSLLVCLSFVAVMLMFYHVVASTSCRMPNRHVTMHDMLLC